MKMWFPNTAQWAAMWIGLILAFAGWGIDRSDSAVPFLSVFAVIATVFVVWMIEETHDANQAIKINERNTLW